jgi:HD-GYP domain-containing protein (c-di-GMP phosphodiesterase class II)
MKQYSPGLAFRLPVALLNNKAMTLAEVFPELTGYEEALSKIQDQSNPSIQIEHIKYLLFNSDSGTPTPESARYYDLFLYPYQGGYLVVVRDVADAGELEQSVVQQRNQLHLERSQLIRKLGDAVDSLNLAYETTLEGWARTLELRDAETRGHSQRVVEMTLGIARLIGIDNSALLDVRHGALLHDIGKMAIPDSILHKPGPLDEEEWKTMRLHPVFAYQLLSSIDYLKSALDIPYYHHEKWDGSGYPCGLQKENIPITARIFSVVDVYDALTHDRPYRNSWGEKETIRYISAGSETSFDPLVVKYFLKFLRSSRA